MIDNTTALVLGGFFLWFFVSQGKVESTNNFAENSNVLVFLGLIVMLYAYQQNQKPRRTFIPRKFADAGTGTGAYVAGRTRNLGGGYDSVKSCCRDSCKECVKTATRKSRTSACTRCEAGIPDACCQPYLIDKDSCTACVVNDGDGI